MSEHGRKKGLRIVGKRPSKSSVTPCAGRQVRSSAATADRGTWAIKWSFAALVATALFQSAVVAASGSVALLADTIHNIADAGAAVPLWIAFALARRMPSGRFTYGYGRAEDLAGVVIVLAILLSAFLVGYESILHLLQLRPMTNAWAVAVASVVGFLGNEIAAMVRMKVGREIKSASLVADGYHARVDGLTSVAVLGGVIGFWLGYPAADPIVGLVITVMIIVMVREPIKSVFVRLLDGVEPGVTDEIRRVVKHTPGVRDITELQVRWAGHRLHVELSIAVGPGLSARTGHSIAEDVQNRLEQSLGCPCKATIHVDPLDAPGRMYRAA